MIAIFRALALTLGQLGDRRFAMVILKGLAIAVALLAGATWLVGALAGWLIPGTVTLPFVGQVTFLDEVGSGLAVASMLVLSMVLMVPVASVFTGLFLDEVAQAVEARHYPDSLPARRQPIAEALRDTFAYLGVLLLANLVALIVYVLLAPLAPIVFWAVNGLLLGREYGQLVALRHLDEAEARAFRRRNLPWLWLAGTLVAVPLTVPVLNLVVPVLAAALFTHLFHLSNARRKAYSGGL
ncbi:MAG: hypothetical protein D6688_06110 [Alphaproteobacteria bacterium]|nr:MAG: hypothetical protein D6688_06110 [Alphaproteobacteria bacterium]